MTEPEITTIKHIKWKNYSNDEDNTLIWKVYEELFGAPEESKTCQDCIRAALNKIITHIESNGL